MTNWTAERQAAAEFGRRGALARLQAIRAKVDTQVPHLSEDERAAIAAYEYRRVLTEAARLGGKARWANHKAARKSPRAPVGAGTDK